MTRLCFLITCLTSVVLTAQTTRNVPANFATIQAAINASSAGDTVLVAPGTYMQSINFGGRAITVKSSGGPNVTTIRGSAGIAVVSFITNEGSASVLEGFRVMNGSPGILCQATSPTIRNCTITQNSSVGVSGAGVRCLAANPGNDCSPMLVDCRITGNSVHDERGAGLSVRVTAGISTITLQGCVVSGNVQTQTSAGVVGGGGVYIARTDTMQGSLVPSISDSRILQNVAFGRGGGVLFENVAAGTIERCRIEGNSSNTGVNSIGNGGGGLALRTSSAVIQDCEIVGNSSQSLGGGIRIEGGQLQVCSCTITANVGGGVAALPDFTPSVMTMANSIIWGNSIPDYVQSIPGATLTAGFCVLGVGQVLPGATNLFVDPLFVDPAGGDYHLSSSSPCVDAGNTFIAPVSLLDIDGSQRIVGPTLDIGADEVPAQTLPGTHEDFDLYARIDGQGDPLASVVNAPAGSHLELRTHSAGETFVGAPILVFGQIYPAGSPPLGLVAQPSIHLDVAGAFVVFDSNTAGAAFAPGLDPDGISLSFLIPVGLGGAAFRAQSFALTNLAANGLFAVSAARDVVF